MSKKSSFKNILLINPSNKVYIEDSGSPVQRKHCNPPLGLAYLAASLQKNGYNVTVLDALAEGYDNEWFNPPFLYYGLKNSTILNNIAAKKPDIIGISVLFSNIIGDVFVLCKEIKKRFAKLPIVLGGHHPSGVPEEVMKNPGVDYVLLGEADFSIVALIDSLNGYISCTDVPGLYYKENGNIKNTIKSIKPSVSGDGWNYYNTYNAVIGLGLPFDLDTLPRPAWDLFNMDLYWNASVRIGGGDVIQKRFGVIMASRGCRNSCYFCTSPLVSGWKALRCRSVESLFEEISYLRDNMGVNLIQFFDDNFFANKTWAMDVLQMIAENFQDMLFDITSGIEANQIDENVIDLLAKANIYKCIISIESGDPDIQDKVIDKKVKLNRVTMIIKRLKEKNIETRTQFMIGFPDETRSQINSTIELAKTLDADDLFIGIVTPLPGTPLFDECKKRGLFLDGFDLNNIRYSMPNIRLPDTTPEQLEHIRRTIWLEKFAEKSQKAKINFYNLHRSFDNPKDYEDCGFVTLNKIRKKMRISIKPGLTAPTFM